MHKKTNNLREFGKFRLDPEKRVLWYGDEPVGLAPKEIDLLSVFTERSGEVLTKEELLERVWPDSFVGESNLSRHIYCIRKAFEQLGEDGGMIQTVSRRGYRFAGEVRQADELIIERHSISKTLIEEIETTADPGLKGLPASLKPMHSRRWKTAIVGLAATLIAAFGFSLYRGNASAGEQPKPIRSIAVLPLRSLDGDEGKSIGMGFADTLITRLGKIRDLNVVSINAVSKYAREEKDPAEAGRELGADAVLEGSIQRANGKLRVLLRLINSSDGGQIWSATFDEAEAEIFRLQDALAAKSFQALSLDLASGQSWQRPTESLKAYNLFLLGEYHFRLRETERAGIFFKKALEADPEFAEAWAGLAGAHAMAANPEADNAASKAIELKPGLGHAHAVRGFIKMFLNWDWAEAESSLERAVALDPRSVEAHHWRGIYFTIRGRYDEAKGEMRKALELDPSSANMISDLGHIYYFSRQYEEAEKILLRAEEMKPLITGNRLADLYKLQGRGRESIERRLDVALESLNSAEREAKRAQYLKIFEKEGMHGIAKLDIDYFLAAISKKDKPELQSDHHFGIARSYLDLGDPEKAAEFLNKSLDVKLPFETMNFGHPFLANDPLWDGARKTKGFQEFLRKMKLI